MRRMRRFGSIVPHHLAIPVICRDNHLPALRQHRLGDPADAAIDRFHRPDGGIKVTPMPLRLMWVMLKNLNRQCYVILLIITQPQEVALAQQQLEVRLDQALLPTL